MVKGHSEKHPASLQVLFEELHCKKTELLYLSGMVVFFMGLNASLSGLPAPAICESIFDMSTPFHQIGSMQ